MAQITARISTVLKKSTAQVSTLNPGQVSQVEQGKTFPVSDYEPAEGGHYLVTLKFDAGQWYIFKDHWDCSWIDNRPFEIVFKKPDTDQEFNTGDIINFEGTADSPITQVELWADDRWLLKTVPVNQGKWSLSYAFNGAGTRSIHAKGLDGSNTIVDQDQIWVSIEASVDLNQNLTSNFTLKEMTRSDTAQMLGIDNTPTPGEIERLRSLCQKVLQPARDALGPIQVNSAFRSKELNEAIGGAPNSAHRLGYAADVELATDNTQNRKLALWVAENKMSEVDQMILEFGTLQQPEWIHISIEPRTPKRQQILRASKSNGGTVYNTISVDTIRNA